MKKDSRPPQISGMVIPSMAKVGKTYRLVEKLLDIHGETIKVGDTVRTRQPEGGILPPAEATTGVVVIPPEEYRKDGLYSDTLFLEYTKIYRGKEIKCYIDLEGKINEILED